MTWANAGAPEGNPSDLPPPPTYATEWSIGKPDAVFSMQEDYPIPAEGDDRVPVLRGADQLHRGQVDSGDGSAAGNRRPAPRASSTRAPPPAAPAPRRSAGCRAGSAAAAASGAAVHRSPRDVGDSGRRRPAGRRCRRSSASRSDPNDRPAPRRMGPSIGGFAPGQCDPRLPGRARRCGCRPARR